MVYSISKYTIICTAVLFIISTSAVLSVYNVNGVGWDFLSRYLNGRTLSSSYFYSHLDVFNIKMPLNVTVLGKNYIINVQPSVAVSNGIYFDDVWDPLPSVLIGIFIIFANGMALQAYLVFLLLLLFFACYIAAKKLDMNPLLLLSLVVAPYVINFTILYNGGEILALSFAMITMGFVVKKDYKAGIFMGLTCLAKYGSLILFPILLLLGDRKTIFKAILLDILITAPWLLFNFLIYGNPLQSYLIQIAEIQPQNSGGSFFSMLSSIIWYPLIVFAVSALLLLYLKRSLPKTSKKLIEATKNLFKNQRNRIVFSFLVLAFIGFWFVYNNAQGAIRLGYLVYGSMSILAAVALNAKEIKKVKINIIKKRYALDQILPYVVFAVTLILLCMLYLNWTQIHFNVLRVLGFKNQEFTLAVSALQAHNLSGCRIVSNAWPYMNFYNVTTYPPYLCNSTRGKNADISIRKRRRPELLRRRDKQPYRNVANLQLYKLFNISAKQLYMHKMSQN